MFMVNVMMMMLMLMVIVVGKKIFKDSALGRFFHRVAMSVYVSVPFSCYFLACNQTGSSIGHACNQSGSTIGHASILRVEP